MDRLTITDLFTNQGITPNFVTDFNQSINHFNLINPFNQQKHLGRIHYPYSNPIIKVVFTTLNQIEKYGSYSLPLIKPDNLLFQSNNSLFYFNPIIQSNPTLFYFLIFFNPFIVGNNQIIVLLFLSQIHRYSFSHDHKSKSANC